MVNEDAIYFDILRFFSIPLSKSMKFTTNQLIIYKKQIERIQKDDMRIHAGAIGLALSKDGDKPKGGEN